MRATNRMPLEPTKSRVKKNWEKGVGQVWEAKFHRQKALTIEQMFGRLFLCSRRKTYIPLAPLI